MSNPPNLEELTGQLIEFRDARDWRQFHSLKDLILSLNLESSCGCAYSRTTVLPIRTF